MSKVNLLSRITDSLFRNEDCLISDKTSEIMVSLKGDSTNSTSFDVRVNIINNIRQETCKIMLDKREYLEKELAETNAAIELLESTNKLLDEK